MNEPIEASPLRRLFVLAVVLGTGGMIGGWLFSEPAILSMTLTFGVPLVAMAAYMLIARKIDSTITATEQFADSLYYLGFLMTLVSLMVSLLAFSDQEGGGRDIAGVVSRFGVALVTTIVGLASRIYLVNFRTSVEDSIAQTESALSLAGSRLRERFEDLSREMTVQSQLMNESLHAALEIAASELKAVAKTSKTTVEESAQAFSTSLATAASHVSADTLAGGTAVKDALDDLAASLHTARLPPDALVASVAPAVDALAARISEYAAISEQAAQSHASLAQETRQLVASVGEMAKASTNLTTSVASIGDGAARFESTSRSLEQVVLAVDSVRAALSDQVDLVGIVRREATSMADLLKAQAQHSGDYLASSRKALEQVRADLIAAAEFVRQELSDRASDE